MVIAAQGSWALADISRAWDVAHCVLDVMGSGCSPFEYRICRDGIDAMMIISLKQAPKGSWSVTRAHVTLFSDLQLDAAITLAKELAHDEHLRTRRPIRVEMPGPASTLVLATYLGKPETSAGEVMAA